MEDQDLKWIAKNVDHWPDGKGEVCRVPVQWEVKFDTIGKDHKKYDFIQYAMERRRQGLPVPNAPKTRREMEIDEVIELFKGDFCEERARDVIEKLMDDDCLQLHGWT